MGMEFGRVLYSDRSYGICVNASYGGDAHDGGGGDDDVVQAAAAAALLLAVVSAMLFFLN